MRTPRMALARGQRAAESLMIDTCTVRRIAPGEDPVTGLPTNVSTVVYAGPAKRQSESQFEVSTDVGESLRTTQRFIAHFPVAAFVPAVGDVVEWTACPYDPDRVGTKDRIVGRFNKSLATAMRVYVEQEVV